MFIGYLLGILLGVVICLIVFKLITKTDSADAQPPVKFSAREYMERRDRLLREIELERLNSDYELVLWFGLHGVKLTNEGKIEHVSCLDSEFEFEYRDPASTYPDVYFTVQIAELQRRLCNIPITNIYGRDINGRMIREKFNE